MISFFSKGVFINSFPDGFLELPGLTQGFKTGFCDCVVDSFVSTRLIEDLHGPGSHIAFFGQVIQSIVQSAEREGPSGHFGNLVPDSDTIGLVFEPPYSYEKNLLIDG